MILKHRIAHWLGMNQRRIEFWRPRCGKRMVGFRCRGCGLLQEIKPAYERLGRVDLAKKGGIR